MIVPDLIKAVESGWEKSRLEGLKIQGKHRMNERIRELAEQAGWDNHHSKFDTRIEKFAELIVRECLTQVDKVDDMLDDPKEKVGVSWVGLAIAKHWGIE